MKKWVLIGAGVVVLLGVVTWAYIDATKPLPGTKINDEGRGHVPIGEKVEYHSNPPTSGKHYEAWTKKGVYDEPQDDRNLVHSLEHGYIILSYNCDWVQGTGNRVQGTVEASGSASPSAQLSDKFKSVDCQQLVEKLKGIYEKEGKTKLIVVPRPNLDIQIALTAWDYLDKLNEVDESKIRTFIKQHFNKGPELTMEP